MAMSFSSTNTSGALNVNGVDVLLFNNNRNVGFNGTTPSALWGAGLAVTQYGSTQSIFVGPAGGINLTNNLYNDGTTQRNLTTGTAAGVGVSTSNILLTTYASNTAGAVSSPIAQFVVDTNATLISVTGALGYGTGSGGSVTQATSKATAVTLNTPTGVIVTNAASLGANTTVAFQVNNSLVQTTDSIIITLVGGGTISSYNAWAQAGQTGAFTIFLRNISAGALAEAVVIRYAIIRGASS